MFGREFTKCPNCQGGNVRASKWNSRGEKARNPGMRPVRCAECGMRFMIVAGEDPGRIRLILAGAVAVVVLIVVIAVWPDAKTPPHQESDAGVSITITAAAMKAAEEGDPEAQFSVATSMLADPDLSLAYSSKALEFLQRAADKGHKRAMLRLGQLYRRGVGALQNYGLAAKWIEAAANLGEPEAMLEFGRLYREGVGVARDPVRAYVWMNRAAAARDLAAVREREEVARTLTAAELKQAQDQSTLRDATVPADGGLKPAEEISAR